MSHYESVDPVEEQRRIRRTACNEKCYMGGQSHLSFFLLTDLKEDEKERLLRLIETTDFKQLREVFFHAKNSYERTGSIYDYAPPAARKPDGPNYCTLTKLKDASEADVAKWTKTGLDAIAHGKLAVVLLAGGQGTRLGFEAPKGTLPVGPLSNKSLFQLLTERIVRVKQMAKQAFPQGSASVPFIIMTSDATDPATREFFSKNKNFGLEDIRFLKQDNMPCVDSKGMLLMESRTEFVSSPNGNGGLFSALQGSGMLVKLADEKVEGLHVMGVDNILGKAADPLFVGYAVESGAEIVNKVVERTDPNEPVGVFCTRTQKKRAVPIRGITLKPEYPAGVVLEYSEQNDEIKSAKADSGAGLKFSAANIVNHYFTLDFVTRLVNSEHLSKKYHLAYKKIPCMDVEAMEGGNFWHIHGYKGRDQLSHPNGYKLEIFVFDCFDFAKHVDGLETSREDEFAPVKNAEGADSPGTAKEALSELHKRYLKKAGFEVSGSGYCEISPLISYSGEELSGKLTAASACLPLHLEK